MSDRDCLMQELLDHHLIRKTLAHYCNALDRADEIRLADVYSDEGIDDHGLFNGRGKDFAHFITAGMTKHDGSHHMLGQSLITVTGDIAGAETYFLAVIRQSGTCESAVEMVHQLGGRYIDTLGRQEGESWRISKRVAVRDWSISLPVEQDISAQSGMREARMNRPAPCFEVLNIAHSGTPDHNG
jgi:hypothetical protein